MGELNLPDDLVARLRAVKGKRARLVIDHLLAYGYITTEDLTAYGYTHPPRAIRDVREQGIPIESFNVKDASGKTIAAYRFGDLAQLRANLTSGRQPPSRALKRQLIEQTDGHCALCRGKFDSAYLQVDHRVPFAVAGSDLEDEAAPYMLVCRSCNRAKSWACEHCVNGQETKAVALCKVCYWASPTDYQHVALQTVRRLDLVWADDDTAQFDQLKKWADEQQTELPEFVKNLIRQALDKR